jgi:membrane protein YqaA with SNARE-associated domain
MFLGIKSSLVRLGEWLLTFGSVGLFGIALLDSALLPMPSGPDLVMITLSAINPDWMPLYALAATAGSTTGCALLYLVARRAGASILKRFSPEKREKVENLLGRYDLLAIMIPAILPPPFPFKIFVLSAGVFKLKTVRFITAVFIGRSIRFLIEGWLAIKFGGDAMQIIKQHGIKVLLAVILIALAVFTWRFYRSRRTAATVADEFQPPS